MPFTFRIMEAITGSVLCKNVSLKISQNSQKNICVRASFLKKLQASQACNFIKQEPLTQVFSCEFCNIFKNTFLTKLLWTTAFGIIGSCSKRLVKAIISPFSFLFFRKKIGLFNAKAIVQIGPFPGGSLRIFMFIPSINFLVNCSNGYATTY